MKVVVHGVTKEYVTAQGTTRAIGGVNLEVRDREFFGIIGPTGCGKTTLLHIIAGLPVLGATSEEPGAAVFAAAGTEEAGGDVSILMAFDPHHRLQRALNDVGCVGKEFARAEPRVLVRVEGFVGIDDPRAGALTRSGLDSVRGNIIDRAIDDVCPLADLAHSDQRRIGLIQHVTDFIFVEVFVTHADNLDDAHVWSISFGPHHPGEK